ncbi:GIY-YIG nuclease family protein [Agromyces soli]
MTTCTAIGPDGTGCAQPAEAGAPLRLCTRHLLLAHDWVEREVGVRDAMPSACLACGGRVGLRFDSGTICERCGWRWGDAPDRELAAPVVEVVYYLRFDDRIKIGTTGRLRARVAALPHDELLAIEPGGRLVERSRHERFAASRIPGTEWFERTPELDEHVAALALGVDEVWARYDEWLAARAAAVT